MADPASALVSGRHAPKISSARQASGISSGSTSEAQPISSMPRALEHRAAAPTAPGAAGAKTMTGAGRRRTQPSLSRSGLGAWRRIALRPRGPSPVSSCERLPCYAPRPGHRVICGRRHHRAGLQGLPISWIALQQANLAGSRSLPITRRMRAPHGTPYQRRCALRSSAPCSVPSLAEAWRSSLRLRPIEVVHVIGQGRASLPERTSRHQSWVR